MAFLDFLFGKKGRTEQLPTVSPQQRALINQLGTAYSAQLPGSLQFLAQFLSGSNDALESFQRPALRQFEEQIIPTIAERFSSLGSGAQRSSAFGQQLGQAGKALQEQLAAQRSGLGFNAIGALQSLLSPAFQSQFENLQYQPTQGFLYPAVQGIGQGISGGLASLIGGL